jgi:hypothetical protein
MLEKIFHGFFRSKFFLRRNSLTPDTQPASTHRVGGASHMPQKKNIPCQPSAKKTRMRSSVTGSTNEKRERDFHVNLR